MTKDNHIPQGYKPSPLGPIPEDWEVKRLEGIGSFSKGNGVPKDKIISEGHPCLTYGDLYTKYDYVIKNIKSFIDEETSKVSKEINEGDICFAGSGETPEDIGKCATYLENHPAYAGGDIVILSPDNNINSLWLSYLLNSDIGGKQRYKFAQGFSIVHIYPDNLKQIQIPVPPLPEQQRIVSVLSLWDTAIAKQTALIEQITLRKRGLMQQLLTGKKRLKGFGGEWKEVRLGDVLNRLSNGFIYDTTATHGYKITRIETISDGSINTSKVGFSEEIPAKEYRLKKGDILYSHINSLAHIGKVAFYDIDDDIYHGMNLLLLRTNEKVYNRFLYYLLLTDLFKNYAVKYAKPAVNQASISTSDIRHFCFCIPTIKEQMEIVKIIENADKEIEIQKQKLAARQEQKKGLMQVLLTGKRRIK